jgi:hypothetical protein
VLGMLGTPVKSMMATPSTDVLFPFSFFTFTLYRLSIYGHVLHTR